MNIQPFYTVHCLLFIYHGIHDVKKVLSFEISAIAIAAIINRVAKVDGLALESSSLYGLAAGDAQIAHVAFVS